MKRYAALWGLSRVGFTLLDSKAGADQVAFSEVAPVQQTNAKKSHVKRNVLIIVGVGVAVAAILIGVHAAKCAPLGCKGS
jgi:hypothetical protein